MCVSWGVEEAGNPSPGAGSPPCGSEYRQAGFPSAARGFFAPMARAPLCTQVSTPRMGFGWCGSSSTLAFLPSYPCSSELQGGLPYLR